MCVLQSGHSSDGCDLVSTYCKYDFRKGDFICSELACLCVVIKHFELLEFLIPFVLT